MPIIAKTTSKNNSIPSVKELQNVQKPGPDSCEVIINDRQKNLSPSIIIQETPKTQVSEVIITSKNANSQSYIFWGSFIAFGLIFIGFCGAYIFMQTQCPRANLLRSDDYTEVNYKQSLDPLYKSGDQLNEVYDLITLNSTSALCLSGAPGSYYLSRTGDQSRILVYFNGGGWCYGDNNQSTLQSCYERSKLWVGPETRNQMNNIFSKHPQNQFRNFKKVIFNYCDGFGHQSYKEDPIIVNGTKIYFRGRNITTQRFEDLEKRIGIFSSAKEVVISGGSAGGIAALMWTNYVVERVKVGTVSSLIDSGIFYDFLEINTKTYQHKNRLENLMKFANADADPLIPQCFKDNQDQKANCFFAQNLYKHIKAPMFFVQSVYDTISLPWLIGIRCQSFQNCPEEFLSVAENYREKIISVLRGIAQIPESGVYGVSCAFHGSFHEYHYVNLDMTVPSNSLWTMSRAISHWYRNKKDKNIKIDDISWPKNQGCKHLNLY